MKTFFCILFFAAALAVAPLTAQEVGGPSSASARGSQAAVNTNGNYSDDIVVVSDAQQQALDQAQQQLAQGQGDQAALGTAIKEMQRAQAALAAAKNSPDKLPAAIAAEQAAYQALLKATPREFNVQRQRNNSRSQNSGQQSSGQPNQQQLDQLDLANEQNRYETERQASAPQNAQQREQTQTVDRLKELAQRQQDLNDRMREAQTALQAARTDQQRQDIQEQLKRLADEQRQQLANVDELRQQLAQSPNASQQSDAQQQLDQTRQNMQRASEELQNQSASQALAAGTRAQQQLDQTRQNMQRQTASQFSEQMRQMRSEARDMTQRENEIATNLDALNNGAQQSLDDSAQRQQLVRQMAQQQSALTNLLAQMKDVTEQAETTEPLLSKQLYDTLRRADQMHTDNLLDMESQLADRGFLPQASQAERAARTNITEIADSVQRAADSVLGSQADALRYAQRQLDDLSRQLQREIGQTNSGAPVAGENGGAQNESNRLARAPGNASGEQGTNGITRANRRAAGDRGTNEVAAADGRAGNNPQARQGNEGNPANGNQNGNRGQQPNENGSNGQQASAQGQPNGQRGQSEAQAGNGQRGNRGQQPDGNNNGEQAAAGNQQNGQRGQGQAAAGNNGLRGARGDNQQQANNNPPGQQNNSGQPGENGRQPGGQTGEQQQAANGGGGTADRLRQFAERLGRNNDRAQDNGGPITGNGFVNFSDQLRDVQSVLDSPDLRNQLATVRDRLGGYRSAYRDRQEIPRPDEVRKELLVPLDQVRVWVQEELARQENSASLVPLDRDPVPENYSAVVRQYYEKLGSAQ